MMMAGIKMVHVPYRGEALAMSDLIGDQAQVLMATTGTSIPFVKAGSVRALAVTTPTRVTLVADLPPLADFLPGYAVSGRSGLCAPRNTAADVVALLNRAINAALADPTIRQRIAAMGARPREGRRTASPVCRRRHAALGQGGGFHRTQNELMWAARRPRLLHVIYRGGVPLIAAC